MARNTSNPPHEATFVGVLDVADADTDWHTLTSDDFYTLNSGTVGDKLAAGLVPVGIVVDGSEMAGAVAFRFRAGDVEAGSGAAATGAHSLKVKPGGAASHSWRGLSGVPTSVSYKQGASSDVVQLVVFFESP